MADPFLSSHMQCETILEDLDEDIISLFSQNTQHVADELCSGVSGTVLLGHIGPSVCKYQSPFTPLQRYQNNAFFPPLFYIEL